VWKWRSETPIAWAASVIVSVMRGIGSTGVMYRSGVDGNGVLLGAD
jgi:hypothetical protein